MKKLKVAVLRTIPESAITRLQKRYQVVMNRSGRVLTPTQAHKLVKGASGVISLLTDHIDDELIKAAGPELKVVANYAVGFDNFDLAALEKNGVVGTNTPGQLTDSVAEHSLSLLLDVARRVSEGDRFVRANRYKQWEPMILWGQPLIGRTLGIVGGGRIGAALALMCHNGFRMRILYSDVCHCPDLEKNTGAKRVSLHELLRQSDVVSLHCPLMPSTKHLIGPTELAQMKPTAILINTARGPVVNERALVAALRQKKIFGAGLDVFEFEPALVPGLSKLENVVLTPHIGSATAEARQMMADMATANIEAVLSGRAAKNPVTKIAKPVNLLTTKLVVPE